MRSPFAFLLMSFLALAACASMEGTGGVVVLTVEAGPGVGEVRQLRLVLDGAERRVPEPPAAAGLLPTTLALDLTARAAGLVSLLVQGLGPEGELRGEARVDLALDGTTKEVTARLLPPSPDAGPDGGPTDAGPDDAGPADSGSMDAGPGDAGLADSGPMDAGPGDAGPQDGGASCIPGGCGPSAVCVAGSCQSASVSFSGAAGFVRGSFTVVVSVTGPTPSKVDFEAVQDGTLPLGTDISSPYQLQVDSTSFPDGALVLRAVASYPGGDSLAATRQYSVDNTAPAVDATVLYPTGRTSLVRDASTAEVELAAADPASGVAEVRAGFAPTTSPLAPIAPGRYRFGFNPRTLAWSEPEEDGKMLVPVTWSARDVAGNESSGSLNVVLSRIDWKTSLGRGAGSAIVSNLVSTANGLLVQVDATLYALDPASGAVLGAVTLDKSAVAAGIGEDFAAVYANKGVGGVPHLVDLLDGSAFACPDQPLLNPFLIGVSRGSPPAFFFFASNAIGVSMIAGLPVNATRGGPRGCGPLQTASISVRRGDGGVVNGTTVYYLRENYPVGGPAVVSLARRTFQDSGWSSASEVSLGPSTVAELFPMAAYLDEGAVRVAVVGPSSTGSGFQLAVFSDSLAAVSKLELPSPCEDLVIGPTDPLSHTVPIYLTCGGDVQRINAKRNVLNPDTGFRPNVAVEGKLVLGEGGVLYAPHSDGVLALDVGNGAKRWGIKKLGHPATRMVLRCENRLLLVTEEGTLWSLVADSAGLDDQAHWPVAGRDNQATSNLSLPILGEKPCR